MEITSEGVMAAHSRWQISGKLCPPSLPCSAHASPPPPPRYSELSGDCICLFQNLRKKDHSFRQFWMKVHAGMYRYIYLPIPAKRPLRFSLHSPKTSYVLSTSELFVSVGCSNTCLSLDNYLKNLLGMLTSLGYTVYNTTNNLGA